MYPDLALQAEDRRSALSLLKHLIAGQLWVTWQPWLWVLFGSICRGSELPVEAQNHGLGSEVSQLCVGGADCYCVLPLTSRWVLQARFPTFCWAAPCRDDCAGSFDFFCHTQGLERVILQTRLCFLRYVLAVLLNIFQGQSCTAVQAASGEPCGEEPVGSLAFHLSFIF